MKTGKNGSNTESISSGRISCEFTQAALSHPLPRTNERATPPGIQPVTKQHTVFSFFYFKSLMIDGSPSPSRNRMQLVRLDSGDRDEGIIPEPEDLGDAYAEKIVHGRLVSLRTFLVLSVAVVVLVIITVSLAIALGTSSCSDTPTRKRGSPATEATVPCTTPGCVVLAADVLRAMDPSADPCEDFHAYACGRWEAAHVIPDDRSRW